MNAISALSKTGCPWEQQAKEDDYNYRFFQLYLLQGMNRTVRGAALALCKEHGEDDDAPTLTETIARFKKLAHDYSWGQRANEYDIWKAKFALMRSAKKFAKVMDVTTTKMLKALKENDLKPENFNDLMKAIHVLAQFIPSQEKSDEAVWEPVQYPPQLPRRQVRD